MMRLIIISALGLLPLGCATSNKVAGPSCNEDICYTSNPQGRIKSVIYGKRARPLLIKEITWVPSVVSKSRITQGHLEFELMPSDQGAK